MKPDQIVPEIVIEQRQETTLSQATKQFEDVRKELKAAREIVREEVENCIDYKEFSETKKKLKGLKDYIEGESNVIKARERVRELADRSKLLKEIIAVKMRGQQLSLFDTDVEGEFRLKDTVVYKPNARKTK